MTETVSHFRKIYDEMPATISVPEELQHRRVEVLLLPLDPQGSTIDAAEVDEMGWPHGFIERTAGQWAGAALVRESPGEYEKRESLD